MSNPVEAPVAPVPEPEGRLGPIGRARASLTAIEVLLRLREDQTAPTEEDLAALRNWPGWGPLAPALSDAREGTWAEIGEQLQRLLTPREYRQAEQGTSTAYYTPDRIADACWTALRDLGFTGGRVLEPGCGAGTFINHTPDRMNVEWFGVERDPTTAGIAALLHPDAQIINARLQDAGVQSNSVDAVLGNVPYGNFPARDKTAPKAVTDSIHNYFIWRSVQALRPGGVAILLTSRYTMDSADDTARRAIAKHADLLGAIRLPNGALAEGGTGVLADILIVRRRDTDGPMDDSWMEISEVPQVSGQYVNDYFLQHPEHVLGEFEQGRAAQYGHTLAVKAPEGQDLAAALGEAFTSITAAARDAGREWRVAVGAQPFTEDTLPFPVREDGRKEGSFHLVDGKAHEVVDGELVAVERAGKELPKLIALRDATLKLIEAETDHDTPDEQLEPLRAEVNRLYDAYVRVHGPINRFTLAEGQVDEETGEKSVSRRYPRLGGFRRDPDFVSVLALEDFDDETQTANKAALLVRRVNRRIERPTSASTPEEALSLCLNFKNKIDVPVIAQLLGVEEDQVQGALGELVFPDPDTGELLTAGAYLSGPVVDKLERAEFLLSQGRDDLQRHVDALREVQPEPLPPEDIRAKLGAPWIPVEDVTAFAEDMLGVQVDIIHVAKTATWNVDQPMTIPEAATSEWGTSRVNAFELLDLALNGQAPKVYDTYRLPDGGSRRVRNDKETMLAESKMTALMRRFASWVWEDPDRADRLAADYNRIFNSTVLPKHDGSHLTVDGMDPEFKPYEHQWDFVQRVLSAEEGSLCPYPVGAGKTATMFMTAVKLKQLGVVNKPMIVVPNHLLEQISRDGKRLFPNARILMAGKKDLADARSRMLFAARCATGDWDAIVMTHNSFGRLGVHPVTEATYLEELANEYRVALSAIDGDDANQRRIKEIAKMVDRFDARASDLRSKATDAGVSFENLGVDFIQVDEGHLFKNLALPATTEGMALGKPSKRATDLDLKILTTRERTGRDNVVALYSGTFISNSVREMYVFQHFTMPKRLERLGLGSPDAWAAQFIHFESRPEVGVDGVSFRLKRRPVEYTNADEAIALFAEVAELRPREEFKIKRPKRVDHFVEIEATPNLVQYVGSISDRIDLIQQGKVKPFEDNMLNVITDGRKAALDLELVGMEPDGPGKVGAVVRNVLQIHERTKDLKFPGYPDDVSGGLQLLFCDLGTPNKDRGTQVYGKIRRGLIDGLPEEGLPGIPRERIRFIHDYNSDLAKEQLFTDARAGKVSVLFMSSEKGGTGVNVQPLGVALHHVDPPHKPAEWEQREGRFDRPGNLLIDLDIPVEFYRYIALNSFDSFMFQQLERKQRPIVQIMSGRKVGRVIQEIDPVGAGFGQAKAIAAGNPLLLELADVNGELTVLLNEADGHRQAQSRMKRKVEVLSDQIREAERNLPGMRAMAEMVTAAGDDDTWRTADGRLIDPDDVPSVLAQTAQGSKSTLDLDAGYLWRGLNVGFTWHRKQQFGSVAYESWAHLVAGGHEVDVRLNLSWFGKGQTWRIVKALGEAADEAATAPAEIEQKVATWRAALEDTRSHIGRPFDKHAELEAVRERKAALEAEIADSAASSGRESLAGPQFEPGAAGAEMTEAEMAMHDAAVMAGMTGGTVIVRNEGQVVGVARRVDAPGAVPAAEQQTAANAEEQAEPAPEMVNIAAILRYYEPLFERHGLTGAAAAADYVTRPGYGYEADPDNPLHDLAARIAEAADRARGVFRTGPNERVIYEVGRARQEAGDLLGDISISLVNLMTDTGGGYGAVDLDAILAAQPGTVVDLPPLSSAPPAARPAAEAGTGAAPASTPAPADAPAPEPDSAPQPDPAPRPAAAAARRLADPQLWEEGLRTLLGGAAGVERLEQAARANDSSNFAIVFADWAEDWLMDQYTDPTAGWPEWARRYFGGGEEAHQDRERLHAAAATALYDQLRATADSSAPAPAPAPAEAPTGDADRQALLQDLANAFGDRFKVGHIGGPQAARTHQFAGWAIMTVLSEDQVKGLVSAVAVDGQPPRLDSRRLPGDRVREWIAEQQQAPVSAFYASTSSDLPPVVRGDGDVRLSTRADGLTVEQGDVSTTILWEELPAWIDAAVAHEAANRPANAPAWRYGPLHHEIHFRRDEDNQAIRTAMDALANALRETVPPTDEQLAEARDRFAPPAAPATTTGPSDDTPDEESAPQESGEQQLPESAKVVPGAEGYHYTEEGRTVLLYTEAGEEVGAAKWSYSKYRYEGDVRGDTVRGTEDGATVAKRMANHHAVVYGDRVHRPPLDDQGRDPVWILHNGDDTLVFGVRPEDDTARAAMWTGGGFKESRKVGGWYLPRTWKEPTRKQRVDTAVQVLAAAGRTVTVHVDREERQQPPQRPARLPELNVTAPDLDQVPQFFNAAPFAGQDDLQDIRRLEDAYERWSQHPTVVAYLNQDHDARPNGFGTPDNPIAELRGAYMRAMLAVREPVPGGPNEIVRRIYAVAAWCQALEPAVDADLLDPLQDVYAAAHGLAARSQATIEALAAQPSAAAEETSAPTPAEASATEQPEPGAGGQPLESAPAPGETVPTAVAEESEEQGPAEPGPAPEQSDVPAASPADDGTAVPIVTDEFSILYAAYWELAPAGVAADEATWVNSRIGVAGGVRFDGGIVERLMGEGLLEYGATLNVGITPAGRLRLVELERAGRDEPAVGDRVLLVATGRLGIVGGYHTNEQGVRYADVVCEREGWPNGWDTTVGAPYLTTVQPAAMDPEAAAEAYRVAALRQFPGTLTDPALRGPALETFTAAALTDPQVAQAARANDLNNFVVAVAAWTRGWMTDQWENVPPGEWPDWVRAYFREGDDAVRDRNGLYAELAGPLYAQLRATPDPEPAPAPSPDAADAESDEQLDLFNGDGENTPTPQETPPEPAPTPPAAEDNPAPEPSEATDAPAEDTTTQRDEEEGQLGLFGEAASAPAAAQRSSRPRGRRTPEPADPPGTDTAPAQRQPGTLTAAPPATPEQTPQPAPAPAPDAAEEAPQQPEQDAGDQEPTTDRGEMATPPSATDTDAIPVEDPPAPRSYTETFPLAADARYQLHLTGVDGQGPREGELRYGDTTIAAVRVSALGRWFARLTVDGTPTDVTALNDSPQDAAHQGAILFSALTGEPYGEPPTAAVAADGRLKSRADMLRVELRSAAEQHLRTITVAAARVTANYAQNPQFQALSDQLGKLGAADIDNHGSRQMAANLTAVQQAVNAWGGALPVDPALDERQHLAFPLLNLLYDTTRLHGRLQATLDAAEAERAAAREQEATAAAPAPAEPARDDSAQQTPPPAPDPAPAVEPVRGPTVSLALRAGAEEQVIARVQTDDALRTLVLPGVTVADMPGQDLPAAVDVPMLVRPAQRAEYLVSDEETETWLAAHLSDGLLAPAWNPAGVRAVLVVAVRDTLRDSMAPSVDDVATWLVDTAAEQDGLLRTAHAAADLDAFGTLFAQAADALIRDGSSEHLLWAYLGQQGERRDEVLARATPRAYEQLLALPAPADAPGPERAADVASADQPAPSPDIPEDPEMAAPTGPSTPENEQLASAGEAERQREWRELDAEYHEDALAARAVDDEYERYTNPLHWLDRRDNPDTDLAGGEEESAAVTGDGDARTEAPAESVDTVPEPSEELPLWTGPAGSDPVEDRPLDVVADFEAVQEAWDEHVPADKGTGADLFASVEVELNRLEAMLAEAIAKVKPDPEPQTAAAVQAAEPAAAPSPAEPEEAAKDRDPQQSADAVNMALREADAQAPALQDLPEWQRIQGIRGAFSHLMNVIKERAGEHFDTLMGDGRVADFVRRVSISACEKIAGWAQAGADRLRRNGERGTDLPSAEALLRLGDAALEYRGPRRAGGGTPPPNPSTNGAAGPVDIAALRRMGEALNRPMPGAKRGVSTAAARGRSTTTAKRGGKKAAPGGTEQAGHLRRGAAEQPQARKPNQR